MKKIAKSSKQPTDQNQNEEKKLVLPRKQFNQRDSILTQLFEEQGTVKSVYHCFISFYIIFIFTCTIKEVIYQHRPPRSLNLIHHSFGKLHWVCVIWMANNLTTFLTYYCFLYWGKIRQKAKSKKNVDSLGIFLIAGYYLLSFTAISLIAFNLNLPFASALIVAIESVRFLMKIHSFVRENVPKILLSEPKKEKIDLPTFPKFLYFLYAPTIIYRDEYPRSKKIRRNFIFMRLAEIFALIIFLAYWFEYIATPFFKDACKTKLSLVDLGVTIIEFSLPSIVVLWSVFFIILHSTQNALGEALAFGDRMFYLDWWICTDIQTYYRKWNLIVGDWLYTYLYKDLYEIIFPKNKTVSKFVTILISALVHEWICTIGTGYFFPIVSTIMLFSSGAMSISLNKNSSVCLISFMVSAILAISYMATLHCLEYFSRKNYPEKKNFLSVFWTDSCIEF